MYVVQIFVLQCGTLSWCEKGCLRECGKGVTYANLIKWRTKFWGDCPTAKARRAKIRDALKEARRVYLSHSATEGVIHQKYFPGQFCFKVGGVQVCEKSFANIVGMADANGFKNKVWLSEVEHFQNEGLTGQRCTTKTRTAKSCGVETEASKLEHAYAYILQVVDSMVMDKSAHANYDNHSYLPYQSGNNVFNIYFDSLICSTSNFIFQCCYNYYHAVVAFYDEYEYLMRLMKVPLYAKKTTFTTAYDKVKLDKAKQDIFIRLSNAKGKQGYYSMYHSLYV